ncbi:MAG: response regulator, partial [Candidatus Omnitrophota bacterium]
EVNNYEVIVAYDGKEALEKIKKDKPDAVLLDIMMPGIDGIEVLKRIRKDDAKLPVFILTASSNEDRFKLAEEFGASGFIVKTNDLNKEIFNITNFLKILGK